MVNKINKLINRKEISQLKNTINRVYMYDSQKTLFFITVFTW